MCQKPLNGGEAYPVRTWLSSWNRARQTDRQTDRQRDSGTDRGIVSHAMSALQVLTALAAAQSHGFRHWDLRLKNIMQHRGDPLPCAGACCAHKI